MAFIEQYCVPYMLHPIYVFSVTFIFNLCFTDEKQALKTALDMMPVFQANF